MRAENVRYHQLFGELPPLDHPTSPVDTLLVASLVAPHDVEMTLPAAVIASFDLRVGEDAARSGYTQQLDE